jgi:hypothetical protein
MNNEKIINNWKCNHCCYDNFGFRTICKRCKQQKLVNSSHKKIQNNVQIIHSPPSYINMKYKTREVKQCHDYGESYDRY